MLLAQVASRTSPSSRDLCISEMGAKRDMGKSWREIVRGGGHDLDRRVATDAGSGSSRPVGGGYVRRMSGGRRGSVRAPSTDVRWSSCEQRPCPFPT